MLSFLRKHHFLLCSLMAAVWLFACSLAIVRGCIADIAQERSALYTSAAQLMLKQTPMDVSHTPAVDHQTDHPAHDPCTYHCDNEQNGSFAKNTGSLLAMMAWFALAVCSGLIFAEALFRLPRSHSYRCQPFTPPLSILYQRFNN